MLAFCFLKTVSIDCKTVFCTKFLRKFKRKTVSFIKIIRNFSADDFFRIFHKVRKKFLEFSLAFFQRNAEFIFLRSKFTADFFTVRFKFRICALKVVDDSSGNFGKERLFNSKFHSVSYSAADKTAEYIAGSHIRRRNAFRVTDNKDGSALVVCNNADASVLFFVSSVCIAGKRFNRLDYRLEHFRKINACFSLKNAVRAFKSHTGVNVLLRKFFKSLFIYAVELHKNVVPDFKPVLAVCSLV